MKDQRSSIVAASRHDSITTAPSQKFQSLEKRITKSSNGWKFLLVACFALLVSAYDSFAWSTPQTRNYNGGSPEQPSTIYLGDTGTFGCDSWGTVDGKWGKHRVVIHTSSGISGGSYGDWSSYDSADHNQGTSPRFTATGTWYWGIQVEYTDAGAMQKWYCRNDANWYNMWDTPTADLSVNVQALPNPTSLGAVKDTSGNTATRADLSWTQGASKNVLITKASTTPNGTPNNTTSYSTGNSIGNETVIAGSQSGTSLEVTGLTPGQAYTFSLYSENYSYYSSGAEVSLTMGMPQARNAGGSASDGLPSGTIYLGDRNKVFTLESWGAIEGQWANSRLWLRQGNSDLTGGTAGDWAGAVNQDAKSVTSGVFNATGTWYWGVQTSYGDYSSNFWYKASNADWTEMSANGTSATLSFTVSALNNPSGQSATADSLTAITLNWTTNAQGHHVMIVRSTDSSFTDPTQGSSYTAGSSTIGGDLVIYKGGAASFQDTGLSSNTRYYYKIYSENYSYYSSGVTTDTTTLAPATPTITVSTATLTSFGDVAVDSTSASASYTVTGADITGDITVTAPDQFKVATSSGGSYSSSITLASTGGTVYVKFAPTSAGAKSGNISHTASGASTKNVAVSGTGIAAPSAPTASAATNAATTSFYANWSAGGGGTPTNYFLDIATDSAFNNKVSGFDNKSVGNVTTYSVTGLKVGQYYYRVRAQNLAGTSGNSSTIAAATTTANAQNKSGAASAAVSPSPAIRGDTVTFEFDSWGQVGGNWGQPRLWTSSSSDLTAGTAGDWGNFTNVEPKSVSRQFTTAGTYYWGIQMNYSDPYGTNFWYVRNTTSWAPMYFNPTNNNLTVTVLELTAPTLGSIAVDGANSATRIDLTWTKWSNRNVMITRAIATPTGSPTQGTTHNVNDTFGNQTVIVGSTDATSYEVTGLTPGTTYYFTLYSENYGYHSTGATFTATPTGRPKAQNTGGGGAQPNQPANLYLGDTNKLFTFESWATLEGNYGRAFLWLRHNNADVSGGTRFSGAGFTNVDYKAVSSGQFTQTGTWYWGMQMDYGSPYGSNFWYKASAGTWADMAANGSGSTLSVTVNALGAPTGFGATADGANAIDLAWTRWTGDDSATRNVLIVRKAGSAVTWTPTQGTAYSNGQDVGDGHTVIRGSLAANVFEDTGLTAGTIYHYAIFSENYRYYSTAATASDTTAKQSQTITFGALGNKTYGDSSFPVSATADSGLTVSFSSLDESVATVDGTTVTIVGAGTATIRASQAGNATYDAAPNVDRSFTVSPKAITGSFTAENKTYNGNTSATVASRSLTGVINDDVVTLSGGTATFADANVGSGKTVTLTGATLTGTDAGNYTLTSVSTTTADITKANQTITFAGGAWQSKAPDDAAFELVASASSGLTVTFESSNTGVATVSGSTVTIAGVGTTTITASQAGNENYNAATSVSHDLVVSAEATPPSAPDAYTATALTLTSFQANWSSVPGATSYRLDVATTAGFTGNYVSGYQDATIGSNSEVVTGLTAGQTYYYRVRAVNDQGTSDSSGTITVTLPTPVATIADAPVGQIEFVAAPNLTYEIKYSDNDPGAAMSWSTAATVTPGTTAGSGAITETSRRYFQVVVQGQTPSSEESAIWGIIKPSVPAGYSLFSPPLAISDLSFTGQLGQVLGEALTGNELKNKADFISIRENGGWTKYFLDDQGVWHNFSTDAPLTSEALLPGQGVYIYSAAGATPRFTGPVGNTGSKTVSLASGDWNIIGVSEGKNRTLSNLVFEGGTPTSGTRISQENYDMIVIDTGGGAWRTFARLNNAWVDISGSTAPAVIEPGDGVYYFRYGAAGMSIRF